MEDKVKWINNNVVVRVVKEDKVSELGVIYGFKKDDLSRVAELVYDSTIKLKTNEGRLVQETFEKGTKVYLAEYAGTPFHWDEEELTMIKAPDIKAIFQ